MQYGRGRDNLETSRRKFLAQCGKFAIVTPPAMTLMLAAAHQNFAVAASGGSPGAGGGTAAGGAGALGAGGGGNAGGSSAQFATANGGSGSGSNSLGVDIPPQCAAIKDPVERQICVDEYARGEGGERSRPDANRTRRSGEQEAMLRH